MFRGGIGFLIGGKGVRVVLGFGSSEGFGESVDRLGFIFFYFV